MLTYLKEKYKKHGKKALIAYGCYIVLKWTIVLCFGKYILEYVQS
jgi:hypothetical protein